MGVPAMADYPGGLILIVTGSTLRAEQMDRPLAYYLQAQIEELSTGFDDRLGLVISDRYYLSHPDLHCMPMISVGGPGVNRVAQKLLKRLKPVLTVEDKFFVQMDPDGSDRRASIWGMDNAQTQIAVVTFAERYLKRFAEACWDRHSE
jgi:hypothetical protein